MEIEIRKAEIPKDAEELSRMDAQIFSAEDSFSPADWEGLECYFFIVDGVKAGSMAFRHNSDVSWLDNEDEYPFTPSSLYIVTTGILPNFRKMGFGNFLKNYQLIYAKSRGFSRVVTNCRKSNKAILNLNKKFGFKKFGTIPNYYDNPEENSVVLELKI